MSGNGNGGGDVAGMVPDNGDGSVTGIVPDNNEDSGNDPKYSDGVNINATRHFTIDCGGNEKFEMQLKQLLVSNSVLKGILSWFDKGYSHLTINVSHLDGTQATTTVVGKYEDKSIGLTIDSSCIDENGWNKILEYDNIGYDWSNITSFTLGFSVGLL